MWSFWTQFLAPVLLRDSFEEPECYEHFIDLVYLFGLCLQREISAVEVDTIRSGFIKWVDTYSRWVLFAPKEPQHVDVQQYLLSGKPNATPGFYTPHPLSPSPHGLHRGVGSRVVLLVLSDGTILRPPQARWCCQQTIPLQEFGRLRL